MEVVEGSPGPSVRNSRASSFCAADRQAHATQYAADEDRDEDDDESWVCDFEDSHDSKADCETGESLCEESRDITVQALTFL